MFIVVLHQTTSSAKDFLQAAPTAPFSYHLFIDINGNTTYLVESSRQAKACANCLVDGITNVDQQSYQICFESTDGTLSGPQYMSLGYILSLLDIRLNNVYIHSEISPSNDLKLIDKDKIIKAYNKFLPNKTIYTGLE